MNDFIERMMEIGKLRKIQAYCNNECQKYDDVSKCQEPCKNIKDEIGDIEELEK